MSYAVEFTDVAELEVRNALLWLMSRAPEQAEAWQEGLERAVLSLSELPGRCRLAPENDAFDAEVRQRLYGAYRILFTLIDADGDGSPDTVRILHVRHGAQQHLHHAEDEQDS